MGKSILIIMTALGQIALAQNFNLSVQDTLLAAEERYIYKNIQDVKIITSDGRLISLSEIWDEKPLLLTLIFSRCAGICFPLVWSLKSSVDKVSKNDDFYVVVLSFDTLDTPEDMNALKNGYGLEGNERWIFGIFADKNEIKSFTGEVGFWYTWIDSISQYDHPGMVIGIRQGKVVRMLIGGNITPVKLREVVQEIKGEFIPFYQIQKNLAFRCLNYDPETGKIKIGVGAIIMFTPPVLTFALTLIIFGFARGKSQTSKNQIKTKSMEVKNDAQES